ncbi:MAG: NACHT domain-containing protein [Okeania sp. SIO3I5]|uniref:serine protease n=1 Tax=Okeania sp. SIO3I5 TaxID=2607805 RepID=UPI0013BAA29D|nr:serine protease [Okeania sp. SIO3I5]NEQ35283.1 NACHT domain-containing protein [Okeania sp. SIO3I5]
MENELIKSIVCICHDDGVPEGAGLLVDSKHIVTCAHVITSVIDKSFDDDSIIGSTLNVIIYSSGEPVTLKAKVVKIQPQDNIDFAGLEILAKQDIKSTSNEFLNNNLLSGHQFKVFGFPNYYDNGVWSYGEIRGKHTDDLIQVECNSSSAYFIKKGFSGTPVWDDNLNGWIGIINKADILPESHGATMISASVIQQCWPEVVKLAATTEVQYLSQLVNNMQNFSGIVAYVPLTITVTYNTVKPEPFVDKGIKWSSEFDSSVSNKRTNDGYATTEEKKEIEEVISIHSRFVILGDLGAGKTTSLQHTVIKLSQKRLNTGNGLIPIFVDLSDKWIKPNEDNSTSGYSIGLKNLLKKNWTLKADLEEMLATGKAIVFLDGLNEMGSDKLQKRDAIKNWLQGQSSPRYAIFACRNSSYSNELDLGLPTASIGKLEKNSWILIATKLINYINKYNENQVNLEDFLSLIRSTEQLSCVLSRPYFVERLVQIYDSGGNIPSTEALILDDFAKIVWKRERLQQPNLPDFSAMKTIMGHLAFLLVSDQRFTVSYNQMLKETIGFFKQFFKRNEVSTFNIVIKACVKADLLKCEGDSYKFSDEFFMDYFAAYHMVDNPTKIPMLPDKDNVYVQDSWMKSVSYFYYLLPEEEEDLLNIVKVIVTRNPFIATESILLLDSRLKHCSFLVENLLKLLEKPCSPSFEKALLLAFKKIGSESHNQILQILDNKKADLGKKSIAAWLSGELCIMQAVPKLQEIISSEDSLKTELNSVIAEKERLNKELEDLERKEGWLVFGELALNFGLALISGSPANMSTAFETMKKPPNTIGSLTSNKLREISDLEKKISEFNSITKFISNAKKALNTILSVS